MRLSVLCVSLLVSCVASRPIATNALASRLVLANRNALLTKRELPSCDSSTAKPSTSEGECARMRGATGFRDDSSSGSSPCNLPMPGSEKTGTCYVDAPSEDSQAHLHSHSRVHTGSRTHSDGHIDAADSSSPAEASPGASPSHTDDEHGGHEHEDDQDEGEGSSKPPDTIASPTKAPCTPISTASPSPSPPTRTDTPTASESLSNSPSPSPNPHHHHHHEQGAHNSTKTSPPAASAPGASLHAYEPSKARSIPEWVGLCLFNIFYGFAL